MTKRCTIGSVEVGRSPDQHPQMTIELSCVDGEIIRDHLVITPMTFGRTVAFAESAGVWPTDAERQHFRDYEGVPPATWVERLHGRPLVVVIRDGEILGYVSPDRIGGVA